MLPSYWFKCKIFLLCYCQLCHTLADHRQRGPQNTHDDPWVARDRCTSKDFPYPQCQCNETHVNCVNSQMTSPDWFLHVHDYPNVVSVTFRGNNFEKLPTYVLGVREYEQLAYLNLSANYFVGVEAGAFMGMPNLISLDLSHNEITLAESDVDLLVPIPKLQELRLRKAFPRPMTNASHQIDLLHRMLQNAKLNNLRLLDLSYNDLERIPERLGCAVPNLEVLLLMGNLFRFFHAEPTCYRRLKKLDLFDNYFARLDPQFTQFASALPTNSVSLQRNPFVCDNRSKDFIVWLRTTPTVRDKTLIMCQLGTMGWDACRIRVMDKRLDGGNTDIAKLMCSSASLGTLMNVWRLPIIAAPFVIMRWRRGMAEG